MTCSHDTKTDTQTENCDRAGCSQQKNQALQKDAVLIVLRDQVAK